MYDSRKVFAAACSGMLLFGLSITSLGSILPEMVERFQASKMDAGILTSILPLGILFGSIFCGPLADRYGFKGLLIFCCLLVMAGLEGIAYGNSWTALQGAVFLIGLGGGALNGSTSALVVDTGEGEQSARLSLLGVFFGVGALGMPLILATLSKYAAQQDILAGIGYFVMIIIVYLAFLTFPQPKQKHSFPIRESLKMLAEPTLLLLSGILFFQSGMEGLVNNWVTSFLQSESDVTSRMALLALTLHIAALTTGRLLLGALLHQLPPFRVLAGGLGLSVIGCLLLWQSNSFSLTLSALIIIGFGFAGTFPIVIGKIGELWAELSGTAISIALVIALFGSTLINYLMGLLSHRFDLNTFPPLLIACVLFALVTMAAALRRLQHEK